ncbi:hypothetical protein [Effusibacillus dendaii]|uniref:Uncharacterized protein n=1 Tax=Effusibacillus dendaii TaxID=2743772 RepID=A0A7I8D5I4_9BACL|nr:hypothetical protein [Effusibacillus dendaii]BCJ85345.1 hypothetical protein skT53_03300 [Effusibacillus dendaii]
MRCEVEEKMAVGVWDWMEGCHLQDVISLHRYSLEGALKRIFYLRRSSLSIEELETILMDEYSFRESRSKESLRIRLQKSLQAQHGPFVSDGDRWRLREVDADALHQEIYDLFQQSKQPMKQGELLRMLQQRMNRSKGELMSKVDLQRDWRFARLEEGEWVLTEWDLDTVDVPKKGKEETKVSQTNDIVELVTHELEGYLDQLAQREQEIPQEVIRMFDLEDLSSIERLMQEKRRISSFASDLREMIAKWSRQTDSVNV